ncbi:unnamed protein product [Onchocerca flexuosa]|uniref:Helitron_like_N domain-containing protein n=1 Tax=Onchocerca flexuosa TaxID=387005 RepID=A0A183HJB7_9BILA|nr:unnamed protein product [Onchocerca flexuosa]
MFPIWGRGNLYTTLSGVQKRFIHAAMDVVFEVSGDAVAGAGVEDGTAQALLTDREFRNAFFFLFLNCAQFQQQKTNASYNLLRSTGATDNRLYTEMVGINNRVIKGYGLTTKVVSFF